MEEELEDGPPPGWQSNPQIKQEKTEEMDEEEDGAPPGWQLPISKKKKGEVIKDEEEEDGPPPGLQSNPIKQEEIKKEEEIEEEDEPAPGWQPIPVKDEEIKEEEVMQEEEEEEGPPPGWQPVPVKEEEMGEQDDDDDDGPPPGWQSNPVKDEEIREKEIEEEDDDDGPPPGWQPVPPQLPTPAPPGPSPTLPPVAPHRLPKPAIVSASLVVGNGRTPKGSMTCKCLCGAELSSCEDFSVRIIKWFVVLAADFFLILEEPGLYNAHAAGQSILFWKGLEVIIPNQAAAEHQVGQVKCGSCAVLLMYPYGAQSVKCSSCRFVTEIRVHNKRPPLSVQQGRPPPLPNPVH
ncbi:hypothetical protein RHMOL_Rhmol13G0236600 [Rhododendron molle]|uniref:Uncharacterized protein n=1 Tax=Rhododendron molle TaxID=49168 RepID=A0ACC0L9X1_RHOML|nr:hypothetical protein RHMOL_Rhmol13G0236600 [Rhododendron molle]